MKKSRPEERPQAARMDAIERCIERGDLAEANQRLARLQTTFPNFKPLKRLAFAIAFAEGSPMRAVHAAWEWCEASPNSIPAWQALADSSIGELPYLFVHATEKLRALGGTDAGDAARLRPDLDPELGEEEGRRLDLSRVLMACGRIAEAGVLVENIEHPAARNNYAQTLFAAGGIEGAERIWATILEAQPGNSFALKRLLTVRLWLAGKPAALPLAERLLAVEPSNIDEACHQMTGAILLGLLDGAEAVYRAVPGTAWYAEQREWNGQGDSLLHLAGALVAWRQDRRDEAIARLDRIEHEDERSVALRSQCLLASFTGDPPDWMLGELSEWWPVSRILSVQPEKLRSDSELFARWQVPMPHLDYLVAIALNGGRSARTLAIAALKHLAEASDDAAPDARQALISLLGLPCGPDSVRGDLHRWLAENSVLDKEAPLALLVGGKITEVRPLAITIHTEPMVEETVLSPADLETYGKALDAAAGGQMAKGLQLMEKLLSRYPDYPRVLTAVANLREGEKRPVAEWAPLIRRAAEIEPDYFFSRTGLAKLLAREGKLDEARDQIAPLLDMKELHSSEWRSLLLSQIEIARAADDLPAFARLNRMLREHIANVD